MASGNGPPRNQSSSQFGDFDQSFGQCVMTGAEGHPSINVGRNNVNQTQGHILQDEVLSSMGGTMHKSGLEGRMLPSALARGVSFKDFGRTTGK